MCATPAFKPQVAQLKLPRTKLEDLYEQVRVDNSQQTTGFIEDLVPSELERLCSVAHTEGGILLLLPHVRSLTQQPDWDERVVAQRE